MTKQPVSYEDWIEACRRIKELEDSNKALAEALDEALDINIELQKELERDLGGY